MACATLKHNSIILAYREKHVRIFSKKNILEEEYAFDDYGVKQVIKARETKEMKKKKKKAKGKDNSLMN